MAIIGNIPYFQTNPYSNPILPKKMETVESVEICIWLVVSKIFYSEGRIMGGEGVHIVETRMFCTVCLKSSCLLICFHSWSLDLSQTLIQTIQILKEEKAAPKPIEKPKKTKSFTPCHLSSFPSDPLHGSKLFVSFVFFGFLEVFSTRQRF